MVKPNSLHSWLGLGTFLSLILACGLQSGLSLQSFPAAPDFRVTDLEGQVHTLAHYQGKVLLVNFWATWCPPCRAEIPDFIEVYAAQKNRGLEIIGLSVDNLSPSDLKQFVRKAKINYPIALATEDIIRSFQPGEYIPTTIFIDKQGRIRHKHVGQLEKETLLTIFNQLSAEK